MDESKDGDSLNSVQLVVAVGGESDLLEAERFPRFPFRRLGDRAPSFCPCCHNAEWEEQMPSTW